MTVSRCKSNSPTKNSTISNLKSPFPYQIFISGRPRQIIAGTFLICQLRPSKSSFRLKRLQCNCTLPLNTAVLFYFSHQVPESPWFQPQNSVSTWNIATGGSLYYKPQVVSTEVNRSLLFSEHKVTNIVQYRISKSQS